MRAAKPHSSLMATAQRGELLGLPADAQSNLAGSGRTASRHTIAFRTSFRSSRFHRGHGAGARSSVRSSAGGADAAAIGMRRRGLGGAPAHEHAQVDRGKRDRSAARLQGIVDPSRRLGRLSPGAGRTSYLAARRLHVDRGAQQRRQVHGNPVSAQTRPGQFRVLAGPRAYRSVFIAKLAGCAGAHAGLRGGIHRTSGGLFGNGVREPMAFWRNGGADRRCRACHGAVSRPGHECRFEDCIEFAACIERHPTCEAAFVDFGAARKPNTDAISTMALENYLEMRDTAADRKFQLQQALPLDPSALSRRFIRATPW